MKSDELKRMIVTQFDFYNVIEKVIDVNMKKIIDKINELYYNTYKRSGVVQW